MSKHNIPPDKIDDVNISHTQEKKVDSIDCQKNY